MIFPVADASHIGNIRRSIAELARAQGLDEEDTGRVSIIVTEAATNLVKHATGGFLLVRPLECTGGKGIEILAVDSGPGRANIEQCLQDGYSTAGTPGNGLGAIKRMADVFDLYSLSGKGTIILAQIWMRLAKPDKNSIVIGAVSEPYPGEELCGDAWIVHTNYHHTVILLADGLGHGAIANQAAQEALRIAGTAWNQSAINIVEAIHAGIRHTRGCAVSVAEIMWSANTVSFVGVGNVAGMIVHYNHPKRGMVSLNGTAGHIARKIKDFSYPLADGAMVVMHSDGIDTRWDLASYFGLERCHPSIIAAAIFRDHRRDKDDATIVVVKRLAGEP